MSAGPQPREAMSVDDVDCAFVLLAHLIASDGWLHADEVARFRALAEVHGASDATLDQADRVLGVRDDAIPFDIAVRHVPRRRRRAVLQLLAETAWADGRVAPEERHFLNRVASSWNIQPATLADMLRKTAPSTAESTRAGPSREPGLAERVIGALDSVFGERSLNAAAHLVDHRLRQRLDEARDRLLLAGEGYDDAISQCAAISEVDFEIADRALGAVTEELDTFRQRLETEAKRLTRHASRTDANHAAEVSGMIREIQQSLDTEVFERAASLRAAHRSRRRTLGSYTVAFMGRTKAGKSTLHAVLTGEGWDAIGKGNQRTTRLNRVYEWNRIRIIDTPGIGAPGGADDEKTARSILHEADLIVYVVTDDSQQPAEFRFLGVLRERLKPVLILLNVKQDVTTPARRARFLKRPGRAFRDVGGHIQRIQRYAAEHYPGGDLPVVPVHLLAAQLARGADADASALREASRVDAFLDRVRASILREGVLRRSQTLLGATALDLQHARNWVHTHAESVEDQHTQLQEVQARISGELKEHATVARESALANVRAVFADIRRSVAPFAESHWNDDAKTLGKAWKKKQENLRVEDRLQAARDSAIADYQRAVGDLLAEVGQELSVLQRLRSRRVDLEGKDSGDTLKNILNFGGKAIALVGAIAMLTQAPWAVPVFIVGTVISLISKLFKSREVQRQEAVAAITTQLTEQIDANQQAVESGLDSAIAEATNQTHAAVTAYFGLLSEVLATLKTRLRHTERRLVARAQELERSYALRVVDWCENSTRPDVADRLDRIAGVFFDGVSLDLQVSPPVNPADGRDLEVASAVLQLPIHLDDAPGV